MTQQQYIIQRKLNILELGETLGNISEACRRLGVSRQHYYDIKDAIAEEGLEGLLEKGRQKPRIGNRGLDSLTFKARPSISDPSRARMALVAPSSSMETKPKPRGRPVSRSAIRRTDSTVPWAANKSRTWSSVALQGKLPT